MWKNLWNGNLNGKWTKPNNLWDPLRRHTVLVRRWFSLSLSSSFSIYRLNLEMWFQFSVHRPSLTTGHSTCHEIQRPFCLWVSFDCWFGKFQIWCNCKIEQINCSQILCSWWEIIKWLVWGFHTTNQIIYVFGWMKNMVSGTVVRLFKTLYPYYNEIQLTNCRFYGKLFRSHWSHVEVGHVTTCCRLTPNVRIPRLNGATI